MSDDEATTTPEVSDMIEDLMNEFIQKGAMTDGATQRVDALFERMQTEQDRIELYRFLPQALTHRHLLSILQLERKLGQHSVAQALRDQALDIDVSPDDRRKILFYVHDTLHNREDDIDGHWKREATRALLRLLATYEKGEAGEICGASTHALAARAVLSHCRYNMRHGQKPETWVFDTICSLEPVKGLERSDKQEHRLLHELLFNILIAGDCRKFKQFKTAHSAQLEAWELCESTLMGQVRMLALCNACQKSMMGVRGDPASVSYTQIGHELDVELCDVERYVIEARSLGLLNAKIDAMGSSIAVKSAHHALMTRGSLRALRDQLNAWRDGADKLLTILDEVRQQQVKEDREQERMEAMDIDRIR
eukprot:TRINITY_DN39410_c0_g1_i1.p1 TRINITY_DN39410_c0_g1~~TRINITY_DN39410_c0_g1_i1.p1  ORF type:complete len:366 (+),score=118.94 TRINITY_DN39410_c0_g1_i1:70-1167(+)